MSDRGGALATSSPGARAAGADGGVRVAVVGMSVRPTCGVRDHATLLAGALEERGVSCSLHWLRRDQADLRGGRSEVRAWTRELAAELERARPDAVLLHYSAFSYSYRGVPFFAHPMLAATRRAGSPTLSVMHELAYPWGRAGWRGRLWALTQRGALVELIRASAAVIVTADFQQRWLETRRWLPRRPLLVAPVFSNLPPPQQRPARRAPGRRIGVFGYAYEGAACSLVLDAVALLRRRAVELELALLGSPGRDSPTAEEWLQAARSRGVEEALSFAGPLPAQELSDELAGCDVLVFCDASGPTSRKGTLAGSLASGTAVVALDGPRRWPELLAAAAAEVVQPTPQALADALGALLADAQRREALGERGRAFADQRMGRARTADAVTALLGELLPGWAAPAPASPA